MGNSPSCSLIPVHGILQEQSHLLLVRTHTQLGSVMGPLTPLGDLHTLEPIGNPIQPDLLSGIQHRHMRDALERGVLQRTIRVLGTRLVDGRRCPVGIHRRVRRALEDQHGSGERFAAVARQIVQGVEIPRLVPVILEQVRLAEQLEGDGLTALETLEELLRLHALFRQPRRELETFKHGLDARADADEHRVQRSRTAHVAVRCWTDGRGGRPRDRAQVALDGVFRQILRRSPRRAATLTVAHDDELLAQAGPCLLRRLHRVDQVVAVRGAGEVLVLYEVALGVMIDAESGIVGRDDHVAL